MQKIPIFKNQVVRDLAWSCFGPNLIDSFPDDIQSLELDLTAERKQRLLELDQNPEPLLSHLSALKSRRLGLYFEALWKFFLLHDEQLELIAHNIPIRNEERSLGELDVVYRNRLSGACTHLELSVKFYLNTETSACSTQPGDFLGPNCKDRLELKLARLISHQSPLSDIPEAKKILTSLGVPSVQKRIAIKGQLFYSEPFLPTADCCAPLSIHHQKGRWDHFSGFCEAAHQHGNWVILDKRNWLSPAAFFETDELQEYTLLTPELLISVLSETFKTDQRPLMVCPMTKTGSMVLETDRYFITPDHWPTHQAESLPPGPAM